MAPLSPLPPHPLSTANIPPPERHHSQLIRVSSQAHSFPLSIMPQEDQPPIEPDAVLLIAAPPLSLLKEARQSDTVVQHLGSNNCWQQNSRQPHMQSSTGWTNGRILPRQKNQIIVKLHLSDHAPAGVLTLSFDPAPVPALSSALIPVPAPVPALSSAPITVLQAGAPQAILAYLRQPQQAYYLGPPQLAYYGPPELIYHGPALTAYFPQQQAYALQQLYYPPPPTHQLVNYQQPLHWRSSSKAMGHCGSSLPHRRRDLLPAAAGTQPEAKCSCCPCSLLN
jgi:hypothetical protein